MTDRGTRRQQKQRNLVRAKKIVGRHWGLVDPGHIDKLSHRLAAHGKLCSCYMCGNPRRHNGEITMQERKADHE